MCIIQALGAATLTIRGFDKNKINTYNCFNYVMAAFLSFHFVFNFASSFTLLS